jgi:hypothetical protein
MAYEELVWPGVPTDTDLVDPGETYNMGIRFSLVNAKPCYGISWRVPDSVSTPPFGIHVAKIWRVSDEVQMASKEFTPTPGVSQQVLFDATVNLAALTNYVASVHTQHYVFRASGGVWPTSPSGNVVTDESRLVSSVNPATYPASAGSALYYVSPLIETDAGPAAVSGAVDLRWSVRNALSQLLDLRWRVLNRANRSLDLRWVSDGVPITTLPPVPGRPTYLSPGELKVQRKLTVAFLRADAREITLERRTRTPDGAGGSVRGPAVSQSAQRFRLLPQEDGATARTTAEGETATPECMVLGRWDANMERFDEFVSDGRRYQIVFISENRQYETKGEAIYLGE